MNAYIAPVHKRSVMDTCEMRMGYDEQGKLEALIIENHAVRLTLVQFEALRDAINVGIRRTERAIRLETQLSRLEEMKTAARAKHRDSPIEVAHGERRTVKKVRLIPPAKVCK